MQQANVRVRAHDFLAIQLEDQAEHTVCGRMLRAKVHGVVPNLAVFGLGPIIWGEVHVLGFIGVYGVAKALVDRYQAGTCLPGRLIGRGCIMAS